MPAIASTEVLTQPRHPSRLPSGSLRSALTGPAAAAEQFPQTRQWRATRCGKFVGALARPVERVPELVTGMGRVVRRILVTPLRYGLNGLIRATSPRQLPTDHDYAVSTREYQTDPPSFWLSSCHLLCRPLPSSGPEILKPG